MPAFESRLPLDVYHQMIQLAALDHTPRSSNGVHSTIHQRILREALYPAQRKTSKAHWKQALEGLRLVNWMLWESYWATYREEPAWWEQHEAENKLFQHSFNALKSCAAPRKVFVKDLECPGARDEFFDEVLSLLPALKDVEFHHPAVNYYEARELPNVRSLTTSFKPNGPWYRMRVRDLPKLRCLIWVGPDPVNHFGFTDIAPNLQALALLHGNQLDSKHCTALQHFFCDFEPAHPGDLSLALAALPSVHTLRFGRRGHITPLAFAKLIAVTNSPLQRLERLTIRAGHPLEGWLKGKERDDVQQVLRQARWDPSRLWVEMLPKLAAGEEEVLQVWRT